MKPILKILWLLILLLSISEKQYSQTIEEPVVVKPSPEAAALGKYGEIPVSLNTGTPEISIPIYEIKGKQLSLPISLSYHGSGFKVSEVSSSVGLGWTLNAGGIITRSVRVRPDDYSGFFEDYPYFMNYVHGVPYVPNNLDPLCNYRIQVHKGLHDLKPDIFYFNFPGYSGRILFSPNKEPVIFPYQNLKIEVQYDGLEGLIEGWIITTQDGIQYSFNPLNPEFDNELTNFRYGGAYYSTWHLQTITSKNSGSEYINFKYEDVGDSWEEPGSTLPKSTKLDKKTGNHVNLCNTFPATPEEEPETTHTKLLSSIEYSSDSLCIHFDYENDRKDITNQQQKRLTSISVLRGKTYFLKSYTLDNDHYFKGDHFCPEPVDTSYQNKRLKLKSLQDNLLDVAYTFDYYEEYQMPPYVSADTDHWGYYNSKHNASHIPEPDPEVLNMYNSISGPIANKETDPEATKACILEKITYPTGGYTSFEWEPHYYSKENESILKGFYQTTSCMGGSISMYGLADSIATTIYEYDPQAYFVPVNISVKLFGVTTSTYGSTMVEKSDGGTGEKHAYLYKIPGSESWDIDFHNLPSHIAIPDSITDIYNPYTNYSSNLVQDNGSIYLLKGVYMLVALISRKDMEGSITASLVYSYNDIEPFYSKNVGGVRIKSITNHDGISNENDVVKNYIYRKDFLESLPTEAPSNWDRSSAELFVNPYSDNSDYDFIDPCDERMVMTSYLVQNNGEPYIWEGYHIGYSEVTEITHGISESVAITYRFMNGLNPQHRNLIINELYVGSDSNIVKQTCYSYTEDESYFAHPAVYEKTVKLLTANWPCELCNIEYSFYDLAPVSQVSTWLGLKSKTETEYFSNGDSLVKKLEYQYLGAENGIHTLPGIETFYKSDGSILETHKKYSGDMLFNSTIDSVNSCLLNKEITRINCLYQKGICKAYEDSLCSSLLINCIENNELHSLIEEYYNSMNNCEPPWYCVSGSSCYYTYCKDKYKYLLDNYFGYLNYCRSFDSECRNVITCELDFTECFSEDDFPCHWLSYQEEKLGAAYPDVKAIIKMQQRNILTAPIEEISLRKVSPEDSTYKLIESKFILYSDGSIITPIKEIYITGFPAIESFSMAQILENGSVQKDELYNSRGKSINYLYVNDNLVEYGIENNYPTSFLWGYIQNLVIATVVNASSNEIHHTSFEEPSDYEFWGEGEIDTSRSRTGRFSLKTTNYDSAEELFWSPYLSIDNATSKRYRYSAWVYSNGPSVDLVFFQRTIHSDNRYHECCSNVVSVRTYETGKWVLLQGEVDVPPSMKEIYIRLDNNNNIGGGQVWFDDVRIHPADAQMTTYTHDPLIGMTSQTDPNGQTIYYEYDGLGRLIRIRDHENNILQEYKYNYANQ